MTNKSLTLLMILAMVAWGSTWVSAKILMRYLDAYSLIYWRFLLSALGLVLVMKITKASFKIDKKGFALASISAMGLIAYNYFFFTGTHYGQAGFGGVLVTTLNPILTFVFIAVISRKLLDMNDWAALLFGAVGVLILLKIWRIDVSFNQGVIYFLLAAATWPWITIVSSYFKEGSALTFSFYMFGLTALGTLIVFLHSNVPSVAVLDTKGWINLIALSLYGTTFGTSVYFTATKHWGGKKASGYFFLVPVSAIAFSSVFLSERIDIYTVIGGVLTVLAIYQLNGYNLVDLREKVLFWRS